MKKLILTICLCSSSLNVFARMPSRELDTIDDYGNYLIERREFYSHLLDGLVLDEEFKCMAEYAEYTGRIDAYNDAIFWLSMIGKAIPRD